MKARGKAWRDARALHLVVYSTCFICGVDDPLVVHHVRYRSGAAGTYEKPGDLVTLCEGHHNKLHAIHGSVPSIKNQLAYFESERSNGISLGPVDVVSSLLGVMPNTVQDRVRSSSAKRKKKGGRRIHRSTPSQKARRSAALEAENTAIRARQLSSTPKSSPSGMWFVSRFPKSCSGCGVHVPAGKGFFKSFVAPAECEVYCGKCKFDLDGVTS